ncbi:MAG: hypothetical protein CHACPFDD_00597 [Phycisphaerae bacterium]|nr:hypothetical protein [Phycisphaerae bacterium]
MCAARGGQAGQDPYRRIGELSGTSMSWRERDYHRADEWPSLQSGPPGGPLTIALLAAQVVAFVLLASSPGGSASRALRPLHASPSLTTLLLHPLASRAVAPSFFWCALTWWLVGWSERRFGAWRTLGWFALGCALAAGAYLAAAGAYPAGAAIGLSGPAGGLLLLLARRARELRGQHERVAGQPIAVEWLAGSIAGGLILLTLLTARGAGLAWVAAAIVPTAAGWFLGPWPRFGRPVGPARTTGRTASRSLRAPRRAAPAPPAPESIDRILDKIRQEGVASLSPEEREQLEAARRAMIERDAASNTL